MHFPTDPKLARYYNGYGPRTPIKTSNGQWSAQFHYGVDITPFTKGQKVACYAIAGAVVESVGHNASAGNYIILRLPNGQRWRYCHLSAYVVAKGQNVGSGQHIGYLGTTGNSTGVHLHLECYINGLNQRIDPWPFIANAASPVRSVQPNPAPAPTPARPQTPKEPDMTAADVAAITKHTQDVANDLRAEVTRQIAVLESRMRRENRPVIMYVSTGADGKTYNVSNSPYAAAVHPASGFVLPLVGPDRSGQIASLKTSGYRLIARDDNAEGQAEGVFFRGIGDILRGSARIDPMSDEAARVAAARALWGLAVGTA